LGTAKLQCITLWLRVCQAMSARTSSGLRTARRRAVRDYHDLRVGETWSAAGAQKFFNATTTSADVFSGADVDIFYAERVGEFSMAGASTMIYIIQTIHGYDRKEGWVP